MRLSRWIGLFCLTAFFFQLITPNAGTALENNSSLVSEPVFNGNFYLFEAGDRKKPSIVLVHGIGNEGAKCFDCLMGDLTNRFHVVTFDLPGFGRSTKGGRLYSPKKYARFLKWVTDKYVGGKFILAGHSMGGAICLKYASEYPDQVEKLVLADVAGILHWIGISKFVTEITPPALKPSFLQNSLSDLISRPFNKINETSGEFLMTSGGDDTGAMIRGVLENDISRKIIFGNDSTRIAGMSLVLEDFTPVLAGIHMPVRILWGEKDKTTPFRTAKLLHYMIPGSSLTIIPKSGHSPMFDDPKQFRKLFMEALADRTNVVDAEDITDGPGGDLVCEKTNGKTISGNFDSITIMNCRDILLDHVRAGKITIRNSEVTMENSEVDGDAVGLEISNSKLTVTGAVISADTAILTEKSVLDLAGVSLNGKKSSVTTKNTENDGEPVLFSVSRIKSPHYRGTVHGVRFVSADEPL